MGEAGEIARGLTSARKRALLEAAPGYCDDDSLSGSERRMFYAMMEDDLFEHRTDYRHPNLSIFITPLGLAVRQQLEEEGRG